MSHNLPHYSGLRPERRSLQLEAGHRSNGPHVLIQKIYGASKRQPRLLALQDTAGIILVHIRVQLSAHQSQNLATSSLSLSLSLSLCLSLSLFMCSLAESVG